MLFDIKNVLVVPVLEPVPVPTCTPFWYIFPLTYKLPPIPAPPVTTNAPVVVETDWVLFDIKNVLVVPVLEPVPVPTCTPFWYIFPLTYKLPPIPAPPVTTNAPVVVDIELSVFVIPTALGTIPPVKTLLLTVSELFWPEITVI